MSNNKEMPDFLKDVPSDFPVLAKKGNDFEGAVVSFKSKKGNE